MGRRASARIREREAGGTRRSLWRSGVMMMMRELGAVLLCRRYYPRLGLPFFCRQVSGLYWRAVHRRPGVLSPSSAFRSVLLPQQFRVRLVGIEWGDFYGACKALGHVGW